MTISENGSGSWNGVIADFEGERGPQAKGYSQSLETGKDKEIDQPPLTFVKSGSLDHTLMLAH